MKFFSIVALFAGIAITAPVATPDEALAALEGRAIVSQTETIKNRPVQLTDMDCSQMSAALWIVWQSVVEVQGVMDTCIVMAPRYIWTLPEHLDLKTANRDPVCI